jgi:hypothetical protein
MKSGGIDGRDYQNWLDAERIVLTRHASQDIEEPEGEEPIITEEVIVEEIEEKAPVHAKQKNEENATVMEEIEVQRPALGTKEDIAMRTEKIRPPKASAKEKKVTSKKTGKKSRKKYHKEI